MAVDVSPLWESLSGVGWYLDRLLGELAARDDLALRLYGPSLAADELPAPKVPLPSGPAVELVAYPAPPDAVVHHGRLVAVIRRLAPLLIAADRNRVVFAPNFFPPRRFQPAIEIGHATLVVTAHDLAFRHFSWTVREETLELLARHLDRTFRNASVIVVPSDAVRREIADSGLVPLSRIRTIHHGPGQLAGAGGGSPTDRPAWAPERYGLFVGTLEPRKNVEMLLAAWRRLRRSVEDPPDLVLCGRYGWKDESLRREIERGRREGWLHHPGYVADAELAALYRDAALLAFPTHYEGFGLPVLEAFAAGTPVVASDLPVLREVGGDAALYAPPDRPDAWARTIGDLLADPDRRAGLVRRGSERVERFSWRRSAEEHAAVFREAAAQKPRKTPR